MKDYRKLKVWQKSHTLTVEAYGISAFLQSPEGWPLRDQALRAAISIQAFPLAFLGFLQRT